MTLNGRVLAAAALLWLAGAGCSTYDATRYYDAEARERPGRIVGKRKFATKAQPAADPKTNMAFIFIPGATQMIMVPLTFTLSTEAVIDVYEYTVETGEGKHTAVYNDYASFEIGHCVTLFTSSKPSYPRISPVGRCPEGKTRS